MTSRNSRNRRLVESICTLAFTFLASTVSMKAETAPTSAPVLNGKIAFISFRDGGDTTHPQIYVMDADGSDQTNVSNNPVGDSMPAWSPDGSRLAFKRMGELGNEDIYVMDADGSNQTRLTNDSNHDRCPAWSPDGSKIAFASDRNGNFQIYVMDADGSHQARLTNNLASDAEPAWSPDGDRIAFVRYQAGGSSEILVMNADGSNQMRLTDTPGRFNESPAWSPDGARIAFDSDRAENRNRDVYVMDADGSNQTRLTSNISFDDGPDWSPDGARIVFTSTRNAGRAAIYIMDADGSNQINLTNNPAWDDGGPRWQRLPVPATPTPTPTGSPTPVASPTPPPIRKSPTPTPAPTPSPTPTPSATPFPSPTPTPTPTAAPSPLPINPNNILVAIGNPVAGSFTPFNGIREFTPTGSLVQTIFFNYNGGSYPPTEYLRDIIVDRDGFLDAYNGTFSPFLTRYSSSSGTFSNSYAHGWSTINNITYGGIAAYQNFVFVTDMNTAAGGDTSGIIRFDTSSHATVRFASGTGFVGLNMGLDGKLYAIPSGSGPAPIRVYDPVTMALLRQIPIPSEFTFGMRRVAVDQQGRLFVFGNQTVYRLKSGGTVEASKSVGFPGVAVTDIEIDEAGRLLLGQEDGRVVLGDTEFANDFTSFLAINDPQVLEWTIFVSFARPQN